MIYMVLDDNVISTKNKNTRTIIKELKVENFIKGCLM